MVAQEEQVKFENLKTQAQKIQEEQFKDKVVTKEETYYTYRPADISEKEWNRTSDSRKQAILRQYERGRGLDYYASRGVLVKTAQTRTVTETIPFTLDEGSNSYENIYATLSPELKQFFSSPETLKAERTGRIQGNIGKVDERINMAKARLQELDAKYQQRKQELEDNWRNRSSSYRNDPKNRERHNEQERDLEDDYEEDTEEQRGIIQGLSEGKSKLSSAQDIDFDAILSYANELGSSYEDRQDARNANRKAQNKAIKELEQRNKEAQAKGFNMTGTITESFVDPKTKKETVKGVKYYLGGAEVSPQEFGKKFDIYQKPSGSQLIVAKGTDFTKLSPAQQEQLFPEEMAKLRASEQERLKGFESNVEGLPVVSQPTPQLPKKSGVRKFFEGAGDVLSGLFLKSTVGLGTRGFISGEPTGLTGDELAQKREEALDKTTIFGFTRGELVRGQPAPAKRSLSSFFNIGGFPVGIDFSGTQIAGYKLSKEVRESGEVTIEQGKLDVATIEGGATRLTALDQEVKDLNTMLETGKIAPALAQQGYTQIEQRRFEVFQDLASKGIKTNIDTSDEGLQTVTFSSRALETDLAPASVKLLRQATPLQKVQLISGGLATEALEFGTIGLVTGGTGTSAKIGLLLTKLPKAVQVGSLIVFGGATLANIGYSGYKGSLRGEEAGIGKVGGFALGAGIPLTQTVAFAGGAYVGNKFYTESIIRRVEQGGFTKPVQEKITIDGKEVKYPAQVRGGKTEFSQQGEITRVVQGDKLSTKIPGTDIKIETSGRIKGAFVGREGRSLGDSVSTISGKQAGALRGQKTFSRALYFDKDGQTAIVSFTKTPKGVRVDQFLTGTEAKDFKVLAEGADGGKTVFIDFNRYVSRVGDPIYVRGGSLSDASIKSTFNRFIGQDQLFSGFADDLAPYSLGRTQQVIAISPKVAKGATFDLPGGSFKVLSETDKFQTFASVGSSRVARTDALKALINQITKQEGGFAVFTKGLAMGKRGQVAFPTFTKPETIAPASAFKIPQTVFSQDQFLSVSPVASELEATIRSALGSNALLGTSALIGGASALGLRNRSRQQLNQRVLQLQMQNLMEIQVQQPTQQQQQRQQQQQQQQLQQLLQQQINPTTPVPTPSPSPTPAFPKLPDFDLEFFDAVRKRAGKKRQKKELFYTQDFTSKIVDLPPQELSQKQINKLIGQTQTGFEIRAPVVLKGSNQSKNQKLLRKLLAQ